MKTLKFGFRDSKILFNKRAIVSVDKLFEIIKEAEKEKIKMYMISYAYEGKMYSIGYDKIETKQYCFGEPNGNMVFFKTLDELVNHCKYENNITVLREIQFGPYNSLQEVSINDNFMLKEYLIDETNSEFNTNMSDELIKMFEELKVAGKKAAKITNVFMIICLIFIIAVIIFALIQGN